MAASGGTPTLEEVGTGGAPILGGVGPGGTPTLEQVGTGATSAAAATQAERVAKINVYIRSISAVDPIVRTNLRMASCEAANTDRVDPEYQATLGAVIEQTGDGLLRPIRGVNGGLAGAGGASVGSAYLSNMQRALLPATTFADTSGMGMMDPMVTAEGTDQENERLWQQRLRNELTKGAEADTLPPSMRLVIPDLRTTTSGFVEAYKLLPGWRMAAAVMTAQNVLETMAKWRGTHMLLDGSTALDDVHEWEAKYLNANIGPTASPAEKEYRDSFSTRTNTRIPQEATSAYLNTPIGYADLWARLVLAPVDAPQRTSVAGIVVPSNKVDRNVVASNGAKRAAAGMGVQNYTPKDFVGHFEHLYRFYEALRATQNEMPYPIAYDGGMFIDNVLTALAVGYEPRTVIAAMQAKWYELLEAAKNAIVSPHSPDTPWETVGTYSLHQMLWAIYGGDERMIPAPDRKSLKPERDFPIAVGMNDVEYEDLLGRLARATNTILPDGMRRKYGVEPWDVVLHDREKCRPRVTIRLPVPFIGSTSAELEDATSSLPWNFLYNNIIAHMNSTPIPSGGALPPEPTPNTYNTAGNRFWSRQPETDADQATMDIPETFYNFLVAVDWDTRLAEWVSALSRRYDSHLSRAQANITANQSVPSANMRDRCIPPAHPYPAHLQGLTLHSQVSTAHRPNSYDICVCSSFRPWQAKRQIRWYSRQKPEPTIFYVGAGPSDWAFPSTSVGIDNLHLVYGYGANAHFSMASALWWDPPLLYNREQGMTVYSNIMYAPPCVGDAVWWRNLPYAFRLIENDAAVAAMEQAIVIMQDVSGVPAITLWEIGMSTDVCVVFVYMVVAIMQSGHSSSTWHGKSDWVAAGNQLDWQAKCREILRHMVRVSEEITVGYVETRLALGFSEAYNSFFARDPLARGRTAERMPVVRIGTGVGARGGGRRTAELRFSGVGAPTVVYNVM